jgi:DNA-binding NarL/FixJ family response regulator
VVAVAAAGEELERLPGAWRAYFLDRLVGAHLALGRRAEAQRAADAARGVAEHTGLGIAVAMAHRAAGAVALDAKQPALAVDRARAAAEITDALGMRLDAALARILAGRALAQSGDRDGAVVELHRAAAELEACGARRYREQAERELGRLGHRTYRRTRPGQAGATGLASLTARELEVAQLIVDRRTNSEIAGELYLSQKTVETHIRNLFFKLGVSSRVEVARVVERARPREVR